MSHRDRVALGDKQIHSLHNITHIGNQRRLNELLATPSKCHHCCTANTLSHSTCSRLVLVIVHVEWLRGVSWEACHSVVDLAYFFYWKCLGNGRAKQYSKVLKKASKQAWGSAWQSRVCRMHHRVVPLSLQTHVFLEGLRLPSSPQGSIMLGGCAWAPSLESCGHWERTLISSQSMCVPSKLRRETHQQSVKKCIKKNKSASKSK